MRCWFPSPSSWRFPRGGGSAALQAIAPNELRTRVIAFSQVVVNFLSVFGPLLVGVLNDFVYGSEDAIGLTFSTMAAFNCPVAAICLGFCLKHLRAALARAEAWEYGREGSMAGRRFTLGVHIGQQNLAAEAMRALWRRLDANGIDWLSVWDHHYEAPPAGGTLPHFETVATLGALAADTRQARLGCLVLFVGYRNPGLLAKAATTLDHLSGGRFELGLGAGWHQWEAQAYGFDFPAIGTRLDMLEEAVQIVRGLLTEERTTFRGRHFRVEDAACLPRPVQARLPIWIGGIGERRTLRLAARCADGWNAAYIPPEEFARLSGILDQWCEREGRDPRGLRRSVNVSFNLRADKGDVGRERERMAAEWGPAADRILEGALLGTPDAAAKRILEYRDAGAEGLNVALRAPWDATAFEAFVTEVIPAVRART